MRRSIAVLATCALASCSRVPPPVATTVPDVRVARVGMSNAAGAIEIVGTVGLRREVTLGFTSAGRIATIRVENGDAVRSGQVLAALDTALVASDLATARAEQTRAGADYARSAKLLEQGWVTRPRVETAQATLAAANARVRAAGFQSRNAVLTAPGPGRVLSRVAEPGQVVVAGTPVLVLGEESGGYVLRVPLTDRYAEAISVGAPATVTLAALGDAPLTGRVIEVSGRADRTTGTYTVAIVLPADARLRAGQIGKATILTRATRSTLLVPPAAVFAPRAGEGFVYVIDAATKRTKLRKVTLGDASDGAVHVTGGLTAGELVATSRVDRLADNMPINPVGPTR